MPKYLQEDVGITENQLKYLLTGESWGAFSQFKTPQEEASAWRRLRNKLIAQCALFNRPWAWWQYDAPEPRRRIDSAPSTGGGDFGMGGDGDCLDYESIPVYLVRHPELLTPHEKKHLQEHGLTSWQRMPASEMADTDYLQAHPELLADFELAALQDYVKSTRGTIQ
jgi:hypothetical protein